VRKPRYSRDPVVNRSLKHSVRDGVWYAVMAGGAESYFSAFALHLKASTAQIGWLASLPPMIGSFMQLLSAWLGRRQTRRRPLYLAGASAQALTFIPLIALPLLIPEHAIALLVASVTLYYAGAHFAAPAWTSVMGDLVPPRRRGRFFGARTRYVTITMFVAMVAAGGVLHGFDAENAVLFGFITIFAVAMLARLVSVYHLARMREPPKPPAAPFPSMEWRTLVARVRASPFARFSMLFAAMQGATAIASPFFTVYMLRDLGFSYFEFTATTATAVLTQFLSLKTWGRLCDAFGTNAVLKVTGAMIPVMPLLWLPTDNIWYLLMIQVFGGVGWSGFSLAANNALYDLVPADKRTNYFALHTVMYSAAVLAGALLGGYLGSILPDHVAAAGASFDLRSPLLGVFLISSLARSLVAVTFLPRLRGARKTRGLPVGRLVMSVVRVVPLSDILFDVITGRRGRTEPGAPVVSKSRE
jgi:MFS family permease